MQFHRTELGMFLILCWVFSVKRSGDGQEFIETYIEIEYSTRVRYGQSGWIIEIQWICYANHNGLRLPLEEGGGGPPCYLSSHTKRTMIVILFLGPSKGGDEIGADKLDASKIGLTKTNRCMSPTSHTVTLSWYC